MNLKLETEFSKTDILKEIDALKKQVDDMRPLPEDVEGRVMQKLRLDWNYHSNAIEGNRLNYGETVAFLMEGITAKGKPLKDHLDIRGHNEAINFLLDIVKDTRPLSETDIRALHKMILVEPYEVKAKTAEGQPTTKRITLGEYKTSPNHVQTATGEIHYYATPEETAAKMQELMEWYGTAVSNKAIHPIVIAALFHHKFVAIHPFDDGNGRLSRILMNLILMQNGFPPVVVKMDDRKNYYSLLSRADVGDGWPFIEYIAERLLSSLQLYIKAINGGDIDEDEDIEKEMALLKMQLSGEINTKEIKTKKAVKQVFFDSLFGLIFKLKEKSDGLVDFFFNNYTALVFRYNGDDPFYTDTFIIEKDRIHFEGKNVFENDISSIDLVIRYGEYKNHDNNFDMMMIFTILFSQFHYRIFLNEKEIISKQYHEKILPVEESKVIKSFISDFKYQLSEKQKSPKS